MQSLGSKNCFGDHMGIVSLEEIVELVFIAAYGVIEHEYDLHVFEIEIFFPFCSQELLVYFSVSLLLDDS